MCGGKSRAGIGAEDKAPWATSRVLSHPGRRQGVGLRGWPAAEPPQCGRVLARLPGLLLTVARGSSFLSRNLIKDCAFKLPGILNSL